MTVNATMATSNRKATQPNTARRVTSENITDYQILGVLANYR